MSYVLVFSWTWMLVPHLMTLQTTWLLYQQDVFAKQYMQDCQSFVYQSFITWMMLSAPPPFPLLFRVPLLNWSDFNFNWLRRATQRLRWALLLLFVSLMTLLNPTHCICHLCSHSCGFKCTGGMYMTYTADLVGCTPRWSFLNLYKSVLLEQFWPLLPHHCPCRYNFQGAWIPAKTLHWSAIALQSSLGLTSR